LGDHIAVLDNGNIQAQGTPLNLKTQHGSGYSLSIVTNVEHADRVKDLARQMMPRVELVNEAAGSLVFGVHSEEVAAIPTLTRQLQSEGMIREWNISQSTIEEVFLRLASQSTSMQSRQQEMQRVNGDLPSPERPLETAVPLATAEVQSSDTPIDEEGGTSEEEDVFASSGALWRLQLVALLRKAVILKKRHWIATLIQLMTPIALMVLAKLFFFKDISVDRWQEMIWPQAVVIVDDNFGVFREQQCDFEWKLWSLIDQDTCSSKEKLILNECAASSLVESRSRGIERFSFSVSGLSGQSEFNVQVAIQDAMRHYLTRSSTVDTQDEADAYCGGASDCGPCFVQPYYFQTQTLNASHIELVVESQGGTVPFDRCQTSYRPCTSDEYRILLSDSTVSARASEILNISSLVIGEVEVEYIDRSSVQFSRVFQPPSVEVGHEDNVGNRCEACQQLVPHVWLAGTNTALFESSLATIGLDVTTKLIEGDFLKSLATNRRFLSENTTPFSEATDLDTSACANIGRFEYGYGYRDGAGEIEREGYIVNLDNLQPWPVGDDDGVSFEGPSILTEPFCNMSLQPLAKYRDLFPDAGISLASFSITGEAISLDVVWELDFDNYNYYRSDSSGDTFTPSQQSVYGLFCPPEETDDDGNCISGSNLICVRAVPLSGCQRYSNYLSDAVVIEMTYKALWAASGFYDSAPVIERLADAVRVTYEAAVSLDELALFVFMITVAVALQAPNTASILVFEKNQRFIFAMLLNGLKLPIYWVAQYLAHLITAGSLVTVAVLMGVFLRLKPFTSQNPNVALLFVVLLSGIHAQFGFVVLLSSMFKKERFAAVLVGFTVLTMLGAAILVHLASGSSLTSEWPGALSLVPMFGFFRCLLLVFWKRYNSELWTHIGVMLGSSTLYLILGIYWQSSTGVGALFRLDCGLFSHLMGSRAAPATAGEDEDDADDVAEADIAKEEHRALKLSANDTAIKIAHLGKTFPARPSPKHAVVDVTMAMDYGEIFGLLGPNGKASYHNKT
jgi:hypothetical protein